MKQQWLRLEARVDAMSLRERLMAFAIAALVLVTIINTLILDPLLAEQKKASQKMRQEQQQIAAMQAEIQARVKTHGADPDSANRERLRRLNQQITDARGELLGLHKSMVSPDKMAAVLDDLLRSNGRLRLVAMKTLPVATLNESTDFADGERTKATVAQGRKELSGGVADGVFRHGVEIVVQGNYGDLLAYLAQIEGLPWQLFWESAKLNADTYPKSTLRLTLFTLSLDKAWLNI